MPISANNSDWKAFRELNNASFIKKGMMFEQGGKRGTISGLYNGKLKARFSDDIYSFDFEDFKQNTVYYDKQMNIVKDYRL